MINSPWLDVINRITTSQPTDLDALVFDQESPGSLDATPSNFPGPGAYLPTPCPALWHSDQSGSARLGVRIDAPLPDVARAASRLAAAALEKSIYPIVMTTLPECGFERFGFRVERVMGDTVEERTACEEQIMSFWNIAIVIDGANIGSLR